MALSDVKSVKSLADALRPAVAADAFQRSPGDTTATRRVAIFAVHGISPIQRYSFQDQVAGGLHGYLEARDGKADHPHVWRATPFWPRAANGAGVAKPRPSALRLSREAPPDGIASYDVYEGYWSPLSKNKTNILSLLRWLLGCTFLASSSTANLPSTLKKLFWDFGYLAVALGMAAALLVGAFFSASAAWKSFLIIYRPATGTLPTVTQLISDPLEALSSLPGSAYLPLVLCVITAYVIVQLWTVLRAHLVRADVAKELMRDASPHGTFHQSTVDAQSWHRWAVGICIATAVILVAGSVASSYQTGHGLSGTLVTFAVLVTVAMLEGARALADFVVDDVLGDVQVYTTHDTNAAYYAVREAIVVIVLESLLGVLNAIDEQGDPLYDDVHVVGHSLGTTIALDVLIRARTLVERGQLDPSLWNRLRSFTTFGTALEKTRFLFDVRNPTVSAAQGQWQGDIYGRFFATEEEVLPPDTQGVMRWRNLWYERDIVANAILSYVSDVSPGESAQLPIDGLKNRPVCSDTVLSCTAPFYAFVHSRYLGDPEFWKIVGPTFARRTEGYGR